MLRAGSHSPAPPGEDTLAAPLVGLSIVLGLGRALTVCAELVTGLERAPTWDDVPALIRAVASRMPSDSCRSPTGAAAPSLAALRARADDVVRRAAAARMRPIALTGPEYPPLLRHLPDPPLILWVSGSAPHLSRAAVAIVGTRKASAAALETARRLGRDLAGAGLLVVSGLARGIDAAAHRGALETGATVAVLGSGVDVVYPPEHRALAEHIVRTGAVTSEFLPGTPPRRAHFPRRNRIVAGLGLGVVVVEAGEVSGALITAREALDQGREVMVVPGQALSGRNRGGHALIKDGAALVEDAADVLAVVKQGRLPWGREPVPPAGSPGGVALPAALAQWRCGEELDLDDLLALLGVSTAELLATATRWELAGLVGRTAEGRLVRLAG